MYRRPSIRAVVCNLWHLKSTNGMFYYALDYLDALNVASASVILVRPSLEGALTATRYGNIVRSCSTLKYIYLMLVSSIKRSAIFTPTPHPFPFIPNQIIVCHDSYPFQGALGKLKLFLLKVAITSSRARLGYINKGDSYRLASKLVCDNSRLSFLPNIPSKGEIIPLPVSNGRLTIGLFGTDSKKKNYELLFDAVMAAGLKKHFTFLVYGHNNRYWKGLAVGYGELDVHLVDSDAEMMKHFLSRIHIVVSVATNEGFGRPIAFAIACGVSCYLISCEIFREFFASDARLFGTVGELLSALANKSPEDVVRGDLKAENSKLISDARRAIESIVCSRDSLKKR